MLPVDFKGANARFGPPENMTDEQCMSVNAWIGEIPIDEAGTLQQSTIVCVKPSYEDIQAIMEGKPIWLGICGSGLVPFFMFTETPEFAK